MAHLFISYSRADRQSIEKLSALLEAAGHSVWWDRHIRGGASFAKDIEAQLHKADAVIVAWSANANESDWVKDEAVFAREKGILIPVCLSDAEAPLGFRQYQSIDFNGWKGDPAAESFQSLLTAIADKSDSDPSQIVSPPPKTLFEKVKTERNYMAGLAAIVLSVVIGGFLLFGRAGNEAATDDAVIATAGQLPSPAELSIAVLPFADMSPEGNQEYFADGLSEELLNVLVRIDGLKVASRTSSFALKNETLSIGEIAERLKVNHILEGSVRKMDNRIRVTAQLIDARDDRHLWSDTYDRHMSDIFRIQDEIANAVLREMQLEFGVDEEKPVEIRTDTENMSAYDMYLKARALFAERQIDSVKESLALYEKVVELDPTFARGWEGLAAVYGVASSYGIVDRDYSALALSANKKALEYDPDLSMPYAVIGLTYRTHYPTPWAESIDNLQKSHRA